MICRVCGGCKTCAASNENHECPYPNCDEYHRCPPKTKTIPVKRPRVNKPKVAKSARESEAEASDRDMETRSTLAPSISLNKGPVPSVIKEGM